MMETQELENLNRTDLFEELKDKCKSIVKRDLYCGLVAWFLVILLLIFAGVRLYNPKNMLYTILWIVLVSLAVGLFLYDCWFLKKVGNFDTPDRLLYCFEKKHRYNLIAWLFSLVFIIGIPFVGRGIDYGLIIGMAIATVITVIIMYYSGGPLWYRKEKDIIEQLRELTDKK